MNNFTIKAQEAVQQAFNIAEAKGQQAVECAHILRGIISQAESITDFLFGKMGVNTSGLAGEIDRLIDTYPKVSGAESYLSPKASEALRKANSHATKMKDKFVTAEHLLLGILETNDQASGILKDHGVTVRDLQEAIGELRKGASVESQTADDTFNALTRYAINLNERASSGKLDPVIGRDDEIRRILQILFHEDISRRQDARLLLHPARQRQRKATLACANRQRDDEDVMRVPRLLQYLQRLFLNKARSAWEVFKYALSHLTLL